MDWKWPSGSVCFCLLHVQVSFCCMRRSAEIWGCSDPGWERRSQGITSATSGLSPAWVMTAHLFSAPELCPKLPSASIRNHEWVGFISEPVGKEAVETLQFKETINEKYKRGNITWRNDEEKLEKKYFSLKNTVGNSINNQCNKSPSLLTQTFKFCNHVNNNSNWRRQEFCVK